MAKASNKGTSKGTDLKKIVAPIQGVATANGGDPTTATPEPIKPNTEDKEAAKLHEIMKPYVKSNPTCKKFLRTSDGQVFFGEFYQNAKEHQKNVDASKEVQVYEVSK